MVEALTSTDVAITATGWICGSPNGLTLTYINDREIGISWIKGVGATNTMIRAAYGRYPTSITDGYLVYLGPLAFCSDTGVDLNETVEGIFYRAWSETGGVWAPNYAEDWFGEHIMLIGNMMFLILFILLPIILTVIAFKSKLAWIMFPVAICWLILALRCNDLTTVVWDTYYIVRMMAVVMILGSLVLGMYIRTKVVSKSEIREVEDADDHMREFQEQMREVKKFRDMGMKRRKY
jgi:hypothetical protein